MTVHYFRMGTDEKAPCGYVPNAKLLGLDYIPVWYGDEYPVTCLDCLMHRPPKRKDRPWENGKKFR